MVSVGLEETGPQPIATALSTQHTTHLEPWVCLDVTCPVLQAPQPLDGLPLQQATDKVTRLRAHVGGVADRPALIDNAAHHLVAEPSKRHTQVAPDLAAPGTIVAVHRAVQQGTEGRRPPNMQEGQLMACAVCWTLRLPSSMCEAGISILQCKACPCCLPSRVMSCSLCAPAPGLVHPSWYNPRQWHFMIPDLPPLGPESWVM